MERKELIEQGYILHHTASRRGYLSRKGPEKVEAYKGRFGCGYIVLSPRFDTSRYVDVAYYVRPV